MANADVGREIDGALLSIRGGTEGRIAGNTRVGRQVKRHVTLWSHLTHPWVNQQCS